MVQQLPKVTLLITAATWAGFALWLGSTPDALLTAFGIDTTTPQMRTEIRAFYGGLELAIAITMFVLWRRDQLAAALLVGGLPLLGSALGRGLGMLIDGSSNLHAGLMTIEILGGTFCLIAIRIVDAEQR